MLGVVGLGVVGLVVAGVVEVGVVEVGVVEVGVVEVIGVAGAAGLWTSVIGSWRITVSPELTTRDFALTVYVTPSFSETNLPSADWVAGTISFAPSLRRTPRYSYLPSDVLQIATRELSVLPNSTAVAGGAHRALEST